VAADQAEYPLDVILPLTGAAAFAGTTEQAALRAYEASVNKSGGIHGRPVRFNVHDDQSNPLIDVQIANQLLPQHPVAVLGPSVTATCSAIMPLFVNGPVNFCFSPTIAPPRDGYVFAAGTSLKAFMLAEYERVRALGYKRLAVVASTDATGQQNERITREAFAQPGSLELVDIESFNPADTSVAAIVSKVRAAKPDIVWVWAIGPAFGTVLRELANAGIDVPVGTSPTNANAELLTQYQAFLPKALIMGGLPYQGKSQTPALKAAAAEYLQAIKDAGVPTNAIQAYAWDPTRVVVSALRTLPAGATAADLKGYLNGLHGFAGLFGTYDMRTGDQHGLDGSDSPLIRWDPAAKDWKPFDGRPGKS
jgi:branched-chain amino acid transport system substrate-binding protein